MIMYGQDKERTMNPMTPIQEKKVKEWEAQGFKVNTVFPCEYALLLNKNLDKVRIYEDGSVWATDTKTGEYTKVRKP
jgi:hypothetical protein